MSQQSNSRVLVLRTAFHDEHGDDCAKNSTEPNEILTSAMSKLQATIIDLNADAMTEADWDEALTAIIEHPRNITL